MGELVKAFHKFLMRDLSYITGGGAVILSFLYVFDRFPEESTSTYWYVLGVAFAYVVGYAIQDALGVLRIIRMKAAHPPNELARWLYKRYDRKTPKPFVEAAYNRGKHWLYTSAAQRYKDDHERIEGLKQVAFTVGPCLIISGILLLIRCLLALVAFDLVLSFALLAIGAVLYLLGWLKVTQQAQYVLRYSRKSQSRTFRRSTKRGSKV
jgi:hypothetical protein